MSCPTCGVAVANDARFCPACGQSIAPTESKSTIPAAADGPSLIGTEIAGGYRILQKLGEGGMGAVYRAEQISLKRQVAIKLLKPELSANEMLLRRFRDEATAVAKLSHPNTVNIYDFGQGKDGSLYIAMEFIEGKSLRSVCHNEAPLVPARALHIAGQIAGSLADAHAHQIVHRDLKPDNVMLQDRGKQRDVARVLDFGIAKLRDDSRATQLALTQAGDLLGTPQYMAPEQVRGDRIDGRTDVYSLGCLLYEMTTGRMPFEATTVMAMLSKHLTEEVVLPSMRRPDLRLPRVIDELVMMAMTKSAAMRPSMDNYAEQIARALATMPQAASGALPVAAVMTPVAPSVYATPAGSPIVTPAHAGQVVAAPPLLTPAPAQPHTWKVAAKPRASRGALYIVLAIVAAGAIGGGTYVATRGSSSSASAKTEKPADPWREDPWGEKAVQTQPTPVLITPEPAPIPPAPAPIPPTPIPPTPTPTPTKVPPIVVQHAPAKPMYPTLDPHAAIEVGNGVRLIVPPDFTSIRNNGVTMMSGNKLPIIIFAAVITEPSNDPQQLIAAYARTTGFTFKGAGKIPVAGMQRGVSNFVGMYNGEAVSQAVIGLIGQNYRVALVFQVPLALQNDQQLGAWGAWFLTHGVFVPR